MAPSLSKYTEVRERLIAQVAAFLGSADANFSGQAISIFDHSPQLGDVWAVVPALAIWWSPDDDIAFISEDRRMVAGNTTSMAFMMFRGYVKGTWNDIEALEVDCRRAILANPGLSCAVTSSIWSRLKFSMEVQTTDTGTDSRFAFESVLAMEVVEDVLS
jgi:hypothetical protein